jgi:hypothetical protein
LCENALKKIKLLNKLDYSQSESSVSLASMGVYADATATAAGAGATGTGTGDAADSADAAAGNTRGTTVWPLVAPTAAAAAATAAAAARTVGLNAEPGMRTGAAAAPSAYAACGEAGRDAAGVCSADAGDEAGKDAGAETGADAGCDDVDAENASTAKGERVAAAAAAAAATGAGITGVAVPAAAAEARMRARAVRGEPSRGAVDEWIEGIGERGVSTATRPTAGDEATEERGETRGAYTPGAADGGWGRKTDGRIKHAPSSSSVSLSEAEYDALARMPKGLWRGSGPSQWAGTGRLPRTERVRDEADAHAEVATEAEVEVGARGLCSGKVHVTPGHETTDSPSPIARTSRVSASHAGHRVPALASVTVGSGTEQTESRAVKALDEHALSVTAGAHDAAKADEATLRGNGPTGAGTAEWGTLASEPDSSESESLGASAGKARGSAGAVRDDESSRGPWPNGRLTKSAWGAPV